MDFDGTMMDINTPLQLFMRYKHVYSYHMETDIMNLVAYKNMQINSMSAFTEWCTNETTQRLPRRLSPPRPPQDRLR